MAHSSTSSVAPLAPLSFLVAPAARHSQGERRVAALGKTNQRRPIAVVFTLRGTLVRVISARDMSRRERKICEQASTEA